jgi:hypothetical protein
MAKKPADIDEYAQWLNEFHNIDISHYLTMDYYLQAAADLRSQFMLCPFWKEITENHELNRIDEQYQVDHKGYKLLLDRDAPPLFTKTYMSFIEKTYRINIVNNKNFPKPPRRRDKADEWITPGNWFESINDIVRTCFTVKYFDGVKYLADKLKEVAQRHALRTEVTFQATDEGHYAAHVYAYPAGFVTNEDGERERVNYQVEMQITTQLQDVIRQMLHQGYEERRVKPRDWEQLWKWDYKAHEFGTNYMAHILHYLEGLIVEIRDRPKGE